MAFPRSRLAVKVGINKDGMVPGESLGLRSISWFHSVVITPSSLSFSFGIFFSIIALSIRILHVVTTKKRIKIIKKKQDND